MKTKILPLMLVLILFISSLNAIALKPTNKKKGIEYLEEKDNISFSQVKIESKGEYLTVDLEEAESYLRAAGKPVLPVYTKTFLFEPGTKIKDVECKISEVKEITIEGKIQPSPQPVPRISIDKKNNENIDEIAEDLDVYSSSDLYPEKWSDYSVSSGLIEGKRSIIVTVRCYPARYSPADNCIHCIDNMDIEISYEEGKNPFPAESTYDLVIITPRKYLLQLLPLKLHKENMGVSTKIKTVESINLQYLLKGSDRPERIKLFIKDAIENWGITYVLLMGARDLQRFKYNIPVRYSNLEDMASFPTWNETYTTDLYYSDIYKGEGEFDDWDSNGNGIFAEWTWTWYTSETFPEGYWGYPIVQQDILDLYPDVYIGRLACKNKDEVKTVVNKIRAYETKSYGKEWFNRMIAVGGDTTPGTSVYEGEEETGLAASYIESLGFEITKLWTSLGTLKEPSDVISAISEGAGFVYFSGHGNPISLSTHPPDDKDNWTEALYNFHMPLLENDDDLPICLVGGCHNSQFDVGLPHIISGILQQGFLRYFSYSSDRDCFGKLTWLLNCWSWNLVRQKNGGTIATIGNTGLGWGTPGTGCVNDLDGWINTHFFKKYTELYQRDDCTLGMVHSETIRDFVDVFNPNYEDNVKDRKTAEQWTLLGDPSLKIGGYESII